MSSTIISDTSCLIALTNIGKLDILKDLFEEVVITNDVYAEFGEPLPDWIIVSEVKDRQKQRELEIKLDRGEASSIALSLEAKTPTLIIDEIKGRKIARSLNIDIIGTIGILLIADRKKTIKDLPLAIQMLIDKGFRLSDKLLEMLNEKYGRWQ